MAAGILLIKFTNIMYYNAIYPTVCIILKINGICHITMSTLLKDDIKVLTPHIYGVIRSVPVVWSTSTSSSSPVRRAWCSMSSITDDTVHRTISSTCSDTRTTQSSQGHAWNDHWSLSVYYTYTIVSRYNSLVAEMNFTFTTGQIDSRSDSHQLSPRSEASELYVTGWLILIRYSTSL